MIGNSAKGHLKHVLLNIPRSQKFFILKDCAVGSGTSIALTICVEFPPSFAAAVVAFFGLLEPGVSGRAGGSAACAAAAPSWDLSRPAEAAAAAGGDRALLREERDDDDRLLLLLLLERRRLCCCCRAKCDAVLNKL